MELQIKTNISIEDHDTRRSVAQTKTTWSRAVTCTDTRTDIVGDECLHLFYLLGKVCSVNCRDDDISEFTTWNDELIKWVTGRNDKEDKREAN